MIIEYKREVGRGVKLFSLVVVVPLVIIVGSLFTVFFIYPMSINAQPIILSILKGDINRIPDVVGYFFILFIVYFSCGGVFLGIVHGALFAPDEYVTIDFEAKKIVIYKKYPFFEDKSNSYSFHAVNYIELKDWSRVSDNSAEILLHMKDVKKPIFLVSMFSFSQGSEEYQKLLSLGLPKKPVST